MEREDEINKCVNRGVLTHGWLPHLFNMTKSFVVPSCLKANTRRPLTLQWKDILSSMEPTTKTIIGSHVNLTKIVPKEIMQDLPISLPWKVLEKVGIPSVAELVIHGAAPMSSALETRHRSTTGGVTDGVQNNFPEPVNRIQQYQLGRAVSVQLPPHPENTSNGREEVEIESRARFRRTSEQLPSTSYRGSGHMRENSPRQTQHHPPVKPTEHGPTVTAQTLRICHETSRYSEGSSVDGETGTATTTAIALSSRGAVNELADPINPSPTTERSFALVDSVTGSTSGPPIQESEAQTSIPVRLPSGTVELPTTETPRLMMRTPIDVVDCVDVSVDGGIADTTSTATQCRNETDDSSVQARPQQSEQATQCEDETVDASVQTRSQLSGHGMGSQTNKVETTDVGVQKQPTITRSTETQCKAATVDVSIQATCKTSTQAVGTHFDYAEMVDVGVEVSPENIRSAEVQGQDDNRNTNTHPECALTSATAGNQMGGVLSVDASTQVSCWVFHIPAQAAQLATTESGIQCDLLLPDAAIQDNRVTTQTESAYTAEPTSNQNCDVLSVDASTQISCWVYHIPAQKEQPATNESGTQCELLSSDAHDNWVTTKIASAHTVESASKQNCEVISVDASTQISSWVYHIAAQATQPPTTVSSTQCEVQSTDVTTQVNWATNTACTQVEEDLEHDSQLAESVVQLNDAATQVIRATNADSTQAAKDAATQVIRTTNTACTQVEEDLENDYYLAESVVQSTDAATQVNWLTHTASTQFEEDLEHDCQLAESLVQLTNAATQINRATNTVSTQAEDDLLNGGQHAKRIVQIVKKFVARPFIQPNIDSESGGVDRMEDEVLWFLSRMRRLFAEKSNSDVNTSSSQESSDLIITDTRRIADQWTNSSQLNTDEHSSSEIVKELPSARSDLTIGVCKIDTINCGISNGVQDGDAVCGLSKAVTISPLENKAEVHQTTELADSEEHAIPVELCQKNEQVRIQADDVFPTISDIRLSQSEPYLFGNGQGSSSLDAEEFFKGTTHSLPNRTECPLELIEMYCRENGSQASPVTLWRINAADNSDFIVKETDGLRASKSESSLPGFPTKCTEEIPPAQETTSGFNKDIKVTTATTCLLGTYEAISDINTGHEFVEPRMSQSKPDLMESPSADENELTAFFRDSAMSLPTEEMDAVSIFNGYEAMIHSLNEMPSSALGHDTSYVQAKSHNIQATTTVQPPAPGRNSVFQKSHSEVHVHQKKSADDKWNRTQSLSVIGTDEFQKLFGQYSGMSPLNEPRSAFDYELSLEDNLDRIIPMGVRQSQSDPCLKPSLPDEVDSDRLAELSSRNFPALKKKLEDLSTLCETYVMTGSIHQNEDTGLRIQETSGEYFPDLSESFVNIQKRTRPPTYTSTDTKKVESLEDVSKLLYRPPSKFQPFAPAKKEVSNTDGRINRISIAALGIDSSNTAAKYTKSKTATFSPVPQDLDNEGDGAKTDSISSSVEDENGWTVPDVDVPILFEDCIEWKLKTDGITHVVLGRGSFGSVEAAKYRQSDGTTVDVAVKIYNYQRSCHSSIIKEAKLLQYLQDTGVFPHYYGYVDIGVGDITNICLVQELFGNGTTLAHLVDGENYLEPNEWMSICIQLVKGLRKIHQKNIFYNDLKENNILVDDSLYGRPIVKFIDVGISTYKQGIVYNYTTEQMDNMTHVAPEVKNHAPTSILSDIYGLGQIYLEINEQTAIPGLINVAEACTNPVPEERVCLDGITTCLVAIAQSQQLF